MKFFPRYVVHGFSNTYLLADDSGPDAAIIDPGYFDGELLKLIESNRLSVKKVFVTHAHESHIKGITTLLKIYDAEIYAFRDSVLNIKTRVVKDGEAVRCGALDIRVIEVPGHSRDSLVFQAENMLFTGDALTAGLTGKTAHDQAHTLLISSLRKKVMSLADDLLIFPGHGPPSRVYLENKHNLILNELCPRARSSSAYF
jgi:hydroxyacylglutathione hydrolase